MKMPDKPDTWAALLAWLSQHAPIIYASLLSCLPSCKDAYRTACLGAVLCARSACLPWGGLWGMHGGALECVDRRRGDLSHGRGRDRRWLAFGKLPCL